MAAKKIYTEMTRVTLILVQLNGILETVSQSEIPMDEFLQEEQGVMEIAGAKEAHPAQQVILLPFAADFFSDIRGWLNKEKKIDILVRYRNILGGVELRTYEGKCETAADAGKNAPSWHRQLLNAGRNGMGGEQAGNLSRNIPVDTFLGLVAHAFLKERFRPSPDSSVVEKIWDLLTGKKPIEYRLNVKGLYAWLDY